MAALGERAVVVTGLGIVSPIGSNRAEFWSSLMTGRGAAGPVRSFDATPFTTRIGCEVPPDVPLLGEGAPTIGRAARLAATAGRQALSHGGVDDEARKEIGLCIGTTMGEACWLEAWDSARVAGGPADVPAEELFRSGPDEVGLNTAALLGLGGPLTNLAGACAAGNYAIARAVDLVRLGRLDRVLAGGADAFSRVAFTGFARLGALAAESCRPFSADRDGIVLGEGAAMLLIESLGAARRRGAPILAEIAGYGLSCDAHHIVSPRADGLGMLRAMEAALRDACMTAADLDYICAHGTGTPANDSAEVAAVRQLVGNRRSPASIPLSSIKALTGHGLGAASAIEAVACILALERQTLPPTWNFRAPDPAADWDVVPNAPRPASIRAALNNAAAFGGNNAAVIFRQATASARPA